MSYWWELQEEYKKLREEAENYKMALEIIANIGKKVEQEPYGMVVYTPKLESIQRFAGQVLVCPEKVKEVFTELNVKNVNF